MEILSTLLGTRNKINSKNGKAVSSFAYCVVFAQWSSPLGCSDSWLYQVMSDSEWADNDNSQKVMKLLEASYWFVLIGPVITWNTTFSSSNNNLDISTCLNSKCGSNKATLFSLSFLMLTQRSFGPRDKSYITHIMRICLTIIILNFTKDRSCVRIINGLIKFIWRKMKSEALHTQDKYMLTRKSTTETVQIAGKWDSPKNRSSWIFWK